MRKWMYVYHLFLWNSMNNWLTFSIIITIPVKNNNFFTHISLYILKSTYILFKLTQVISIARMWVSILTGAYSFFVLFCFQCMLFLALIEIITCGSYNKKQLRLRRWKIMLGLIIVFWNNQETCLCGQLFDSLWPYIDCILPLDVFFPITYTEINIFERSRRK